MSDEYKTGYQDGFRDGFDAAKEEIAKRLKEANDYVKNAPYAPYKFDVGCQVCGIGKNGEPLGYACQHPQCPTRFISLNNMSSTDLNK